MRRTAKGSFEVALAPGTPELEGAVQRREFTKTFHGDLIATGTGGMLSGGDPLGGSAGYIAIETVTGRLNGRSGRFALQQFGLRHHGAQTQHYEVVPGSGNDGLEGIVGTLHLTIDNDGAHRYQLEYELQ